MNIEFNLSPIPIVNTHKYSRIYSDEKQAHCKCLSQRKLRVVSWQYGLQWKYNQSFPFSNIGVFEMKIL